MKQQIQEGDRVEVQRNGCAHWSHDSHWAPDGRRGRVSGSWAGHPGVEDGHFVAVDFYDGNMFVASLTYRLEELVFIRRGKIRRALRMLIDQPAPPDARPAAEGE